MIYAVIVIYNKRCDESLTYTRLSIIDHFMRVVVFDNSVRDLNNSKCCEEMGYTYYHMGENLGVSYAYNYVINHTPHEDNDYFIMLDDDTEITQAYVSEICAVASQAEYDVLLPVVMSNGGILSPSNLRNKCRCQTVKSIDQIVLSRVTAINSGVGVRAGLFKKIMYNEKLFLDYVDHDFMKQAHSINASFKILSSRIIQHYSGNEKTSMDSAINRFKIFLSDYKHFCISCKSGLFYFLYSVKYTIRLTIKYKSLAFIKSFAEKNFFCYRKGGS